MKIIYITILNIFFGVLLSANASIKEVIPHYLHQFASHINKQDEGNTYNIHIISKDKKLKKKFKRILDTKKVRQKSFFITQGATSHIPANTEMVFLGENTKVKLLHVVQNIAGKSILLVSLKEKDKKNVMINFFITKDNKLSFEINRANILLEGFTISDKVILMGGTELDVAKLFKGAKQSLKQQEEVVKKQAKLLKQQKINLSDRNKKLLKAENKLVLLEKRTKKYLADIDKAKKSIKKINKAMNKEKKAYKEQKNKNLTLEEAVKENENINIKVKDELSRMLTIIKEKNKSIKSKLADLDKLNKDILEKENSLKELSKVTKSQGKKISTQENTIDTQEDLLLWMLVIISIFIFLIAIIFMMFRKQRNISRVLKDTQEELIESSKMASLGELVAGLAHEMNTPIGVSVTGVSLLKNENIGIKEKIDSHKLKEEDLLNFVEIIDDVTMSMDVSLQKASQLVSSFKQVSVDQQVEDIREFNFNEYISMVLIGFKRELKHKNIELNIDISDDITLNSYPGVYYQIFTNLINNSLLHAFKEDESGNIWITSKVDKGKLYIKFKDSGKGVSEENLSQIFDPFFTTSRGQGGTGLGLHIIYNLITQKLQGSIKAYSNEGEGLTINMKFPLAIE